MKKSLVETHPELAKQWHPTKNSGLTSSNITAGSGKKVWWKCEKGDDHEWKALVNDRTSGRGCPCCSGQKVVLSNCLTTTHPELAKQWHPTKNSGLTPSDITAGSNKKVWWQCDVADDHEWKALVSSRSNGRGCPCCSNKKAVPSNCLATIHPKLAKQWHPTKNGDLTPNDVTAGSGKKIWWQCSVTDDHVWEATVDKRYSGSGCPTCRESKGEKDIREYLEKHQITHEPQKKFKKSIINRQPFDESVKHTMFTGLIEFQGKQHYHPNSFGSKKKHAKQKMFIGNLERDNNKLQFCRKHNIPFLLIPYWDIDRIPEILDDVFNGEKPTFSEPPKIVTDNFKKRKKIREKLGITEPEVLCGLIK